MRSILHRVCQINRFNMTTAYGLSDECLNLPFACHSGNDHYFVYGHVRDYFVSENPALRIMMIRNPLAWLISRIQHEKRKSGNQIGLNLASAAVNFGGKYLNFLPDDLRTDALKWFNRRIKSSTSPISTGLVIVEYSFIILIFKTISSRADHFSSSNNCIGLGLHEIKRERSFQSPNTITTLTPSLSTLSQTNRLNHVNRNFLKIS